eukprot:TRINITY_DN19508_c0_g2_i1.p1 TRINITY_DN19508_c0_g2~~TRINITY_DN19508_c0_g2_i1.p1  ORF type:complete len:702 (-),score=102.63 TRINITY_DN19508_c0_g2_i1:83-2128(-)
MGLMEHLVEEIVCGGFKCSCSLQINLDLLGELIKFSPPLMRRLNGVLQPGDKFERFMEVILSHLIDSNVFIRSAILSLQSFRTGSPSPAYAGPSPPPRRYQVKNSTTPRRSFPLRPSLAPSPCPPPSAPSPSSPTEDSGTSSLFLTPPVSSYRPAVLPGSSGSHVFGSSARSHGTAASANSMGSNTNSNSNSSSSYRSTTDRLNSSPSYTSVIDPRDRIHSSGSDSVYAGTSERNDSRNPNISSISPIIRQPHLEPRSLTSPSPSAATVSSFPSPSSTFASPFFSPVSTTNSESSRHLANYTSPVGELSVGSPVGILGDSLWRSDDSPAGSSRSPARPTVGSSPSPSDESQCEAGRTFPISLAPRAEGGESVDGRSSVPSSSPQLGGVRMDARSGGRFSGDSEEERGALGMSSGTLGHGHSVRLFGGNEQRGGDREGLSEEGGHGSGQFGRFERTGRGGSQEEEQRRGSRSRREGKNKGQWKSEEWHGQLAVFLETNWIRLLWEMMRTVRDGDVNQDNICVLNTALVFFIFAERAGELALCLATLRALDAQLVTSTDFTFSSSSTSFTHLPASSPRESKSESLQSGSHSPSQSLSDLSPLSSPSLSESGHQFPLRAGDVLQNFSVLLEFWREFYQRKKGRDIASLQYSTNIPFAEWWGVVDRLQGPRDQPTSLLHNLRAPT